ENGVKVFYDKFEETDLWGKDLGVHFDFIYRKSARYCVPFISKHYKEKIWTRHEIKTAIARAIESNDEYILPARFDDTEIDGVRPTLGFIDLRKYSAEEFAKIILQKLKNEPSVAVARQMQKDDAVDVYLGNMVMGDQFGSQVGMALRVVITNKSGDYLYFNEPYFKLSKPAKKASDTFILPEKLNGISFPVKLEHGQPITELYNVKVNSKEIWESVPIDTTVVAVVTTTIGEKFISNELQVKDIIDSLNRIQKR
ncbi:MAG TPA: TIR domain-containing protein, partial [Bacteroidia bacterium]|nr:TIR domain-containing protein [Bacteroidia bacterium]